MALYRIYRYPMPQRPVPRLRLSDEDLTTRMWPPEIPFFAGEMVGKHGSLTKEKSNSNMKLWGFHGIGRLKHETWGFDHVKP